MLLTGLRKISQQKDNSEDRKIIKSAFDIINSPTKQQAPGEKPSTKKENKANSPVHNPKVVLHIDDDPEDREIVRDTVESVDPTFILNEAQNGQEGLEFLNKAKASSNLPCLIILDINMPGMNGPEIYNEIQKDDELKAIPTVIFTTSAVYKGIQFKANENLPIFIKPDNMKEFTTSIIKILTHCKDL